MRQDRVRLRRGLHLSGICIVVCLALPARADETCWAQKSQTATLVSLEGDGTVKLADGANMRLAGIEPPPDAEARAGWQDMIDAIAAPVRLHRVEPPLDRYGRLQMLVVTGEGALLQAQLVAAGLARVMPQKRARDCLGALLATEAEARRAQRGIWRSPAYARRNAGDVDGLRRDEGHYVLVEGTVVEASQRQRRIYFNFGADWRTDFTVTVDPADARLFIAGLEETVPGGLAAMAGRRVRVRGFLSRYNGPEIRATVPEQIEMLTGAEQKED